MTRKFVGTIVLTLFVFAFLAASALGANPWEKDKHTFFPVNLKYSMLKNTIAGGENIGVKVDEDANITGGQHFTFDRGSRGVVTPPITSPGLSMGTTTYEYQHNSRMTRQVAWRGDHNIHFAWMWKNDDILNAIRITAYEAWKASDGTFAFGGPLTNGGKAVHVVSERSGYVGVDVLPVPTGGGDAGRAVVYNHYDLTGSADGLEYLPTLWPDFGPILGNFGPYKQDVPEALLADSVTGEFIWPHATTQITSTNDTIIHIVTRESTDDEFSQLRYFRREGPVDPGASGVSWTGMNVDTTATICYVVEHAPAGAPNPDEVAIIWAAHWPATPGGAESTTPGSLALLVEQNQNDIYAMTSDDAGLTWNAKFNVTQTDSTVGGYVVLGDMSAMYDTDGNLHVVWAARPTGSLEPGATGASALDWEWPLFPYASRVLHWDNSSNFISIVKDGSWDWITPDDPTDDTFAIGGAWHSMALNNPSISQCDDKFYVTYAQFQDLDNGIWDNSDRRAFENIDLNGSANGILFFSVSSNAGQNWDPGRRLTDYTQRCDTDVDDTCHSHFWHSSARYGMLNDAGDDFTGAEVLQDPSWTYTSTDYYLDVVYVDDLEPGGVIQGEGGWTVNPVRWFRVPCVDPIAQPVLAIEPLGVFTPAWDKPGVQRTVDVDLFNIGNTQLTVDGATPVEVEGPTSGWLTVSNVPTTISEVLPNNFETMQVNINAGGIIDASLAPAVLEGRVEVTWETSNTAVFPVDFIVADTLQFPQVDTIATNSIRLAVNNAGGVGLSTIGGEANMDFVASGVEQDDCDLGNSNIETRYLADASPFVMKVNSSDTLISSYVGSHSWFSEHPVNEVKDGFRPQNTLVEGIDGKSAFNEILGSGVFYNADSTIAMEATYYAPNGQADGGNFIGQSFKVWNISGATIDTLYVGQFEDWDIPSDSTVRNSSAYDGSRQLMFHYGYEFTDGDTFCDGIGNNINKADQRYGGSAFIAQWAKDGNGDITYSPTQQGVFSYKLSTFLDGGHIGYDSLYQQILQFGLSGGLTYESTNPPTDSLYMDLFNMPIYGSYTLGVEDTLYFFKTLVSKYQDPGPGPNPQEFFGDVDDAVAHLKQYAGFCCKVWGIAGDVSSPLNPGWPDGTVNIIDILFAIDFKFGDPAGPDTKWPDGEGTQGPAFSCSSLMDVSSALAPGTPDYAVNILDILYLIDHKFGDPPAPAPTCPD